MRAVNQRWQMLIANGCRVSWATRQSHGRPCRFKFGSQCMEANAGCGGKRRRQRTAAAVAKNEESGGGGGNDDERQPRRRQRAVGRQQVDDNDSWVPESEQLTGGKGSGGGPGGVWAKLLPRGPGDGNNGRGATKAWAVLQTQAPGLHGAPAGMRSVVHNKDNQTSCKAPNTFI